MNVGKATTWCGLIAVVALLFIPATPVLAGQQPDRLERFGADPIETHRDAGSLPIPEGIAS